MTKTAKVQSIYPTKEELITYEREDDLARKSLKAKAENKNYKLKKAELYNQVNDNLSETAFYRERLISALTLPEFLETSVKNVKENTQNDLFAVLSAENEGNLEADYSEAV